MPFRGIDDRTMCVFLGLMFYRPAGVLFCAWQVLVCLSQGTLKETNDGNRMRECFVDLLSECEKWRK